MLQVIYIVYSYSVMPFNLCPKFKNSVCLYTCIKFESHQLLNSSGTINPETCNLYLGNLGEVNDKENKSKLSHCGEHNINLNYCCQALHKSYVSGYS